MNPNPPSARTYFTLVAALLLVFGGGWLAHTVQTAGGEVAVRDVRFAGSNGLVMHGKLYLPNGVTDDAPAPAVLAVHGYINSNETQSPYAIEYARRGYVVLALDQTGHGYSDPPAFANGFGGPDGLRYLRGLSFVDPERITLEGHSMGGWAVLVAAGAAPEAYTSVVVSGSSTGTFGAPEGTSAFPRNFGLVFSRFDEFSQLMWGAAVPREIVATDKLRSVMGTDAPVEIGRLYGDVGTGTARRLSMPPVTHPGDHITVAGVAPTIDWLQTTNPAPNPLPPLEQVWFWKEIGTLLALVGAIAFLFPFGRVLLATRFFGELRTRPAEAVGMTGGGWWLAALLTAILPIVTYFPFQNWTTAAIPTSAFFPQNITTGITGWAVGTGAISLLLLLLWWGTHRRRRTLRAANLGLGWDVPDFGLRGVVKSLLLALATVAGAYALLALSNAVFGTDFRFWVIAVKLMSSLQLRIFLSYVLPLSLFFMVLGVVLHGQLRARELPTGTAMVRNWLITTVGFVLLLLVQYLPLLSGGTLPLGEPLLTIVAIQFVFWLGIAGLISTYFFHQTGAVYAGGFINGLLLAWIIVASQATHHPF